MTINVYSKINQRVIFSYFKIVYISHLPILFFSLIDKLSNSQKILSKCLHFPLCTIDKNNIKIQSVYFLSTQNQINTISNVIYMQCTLVPLHLCFKYLIFVYSFNNKTYHWIWIFFEVLGFVSYPFLTDFPNFIFLVFIIVICKIFLLNPATIVFAIFRRWQRQLDEFCIQC